MKKAMSLLMAVSFCAVALEIVLPEAPSMFEETAAEELALHLEKAYGGNVSQVAETEAKGGLAIYVGNTALAKRNGIDCAKMDN